MNILVSACLLGEPCRYDGRAKPCAAVQALAKQHRLVPVCPEVLGGLSTPRLPSELQPTEAGVRVVNAEGGDVTTAFERGADIACRLAEDEGCTMAVLKSGSPSCGSETVYDGTFTGRLRRGEGVAAARLREQGVTVVDEEHLGALPLENGNDR
ncbi:DUF523 domain-containing protein [Adlercreutzia equolifaciens]|uniref:DUF523 domain-containing protein n=1 Tax=Adlercreutzia equolifaciens TaxID=446660 RepID=UPI0023B0FECB|nr:DUF523 domain-containing protein [Adlercreutzia equolifaciens]MDE8703353.1 DUF523 domain-containing protein [Adlercreutzia equolifaciens]